MTESKLMTVAQGIQELKLIDQKVEKRRQNLKVLCAYASDKKPVYEDQTAKVKSLRQSILDLLDRKCKIKAAIMQANLTTKVSWKGTDRTLQQILFLKQEGAGQVQGMLTSLDHSQIEREVEARKSRDDKSNVVTVLCYDPAEKERALEAHLDLQGNLDVLIDSANHGTFIDVEHYPGDEFDTEKK